MPVYKLIRYHTVLAGILIFCCVFGLKPMRAFLFCFTSLPKTGQDKFAVLFNLFVGECAKRIEEYSSGSFVGLGGFGVCGLKFCLDHFKRIGRWSIARDAHRFNISQAQFRLMRLVTSTNGFKYKMAIGLKGSVVDPLLSPSPPCSLDVLVFPIHSLVAQSGLEFPVDEMFDCELPRRLVSQGP